MFQFFSIMIFFASLLYGAWYFIGDDTKNEDSSLVNSSYEKYLQEAIERNTQTYSVEFKRSDFVSINSIENKDLTSTDQGTNEELTHSENTVGNSHKTQYSGASSDTSDSSIVSKSGNFGTPEIKATTPSGPINCDGGLLYDPCLVVGDPIAASGDMYFGSNRKF